ncbi:hypothetical protein ADIARSV_1686 [Arcticibacter svalbardensis MN12-7]|uniref:Uncharacterized protein n=2 Tax=Arcticibacter TaxID=1288026 RepID=R9GU61_9SPHI|nr:hypothetical protein ADIARSV_1686 [Arcticibacter svalbardensis MN12-7]
MITLAFALGGVIMYLWNAILPDLLGVKVIGYWQSLGLLVMCKILFGSFGPHRHHEHGQRNSFLRERLAGMNDEERQKFREEWKNREEWRRRC